jgi:hypothetical protein
MMITGRTGHATIDDPSGQGTGGERQVGVAYGATSTAWAQDVPRGGPRGWPGSGGNDP